QRLHREAHRIRPLLHRELVAPPRREDPHPHDPPRLRPEARVLSAVLCAALLLAPAVAKTFDPATYGAQAGGDAAANTRAIQEAIDAAAAAGGGIVALPQPGTYDVATQGPNAYHKNHRYCLELRGDGLTLSI